MSLRTVFTASDVAELEGFRSAVQALARLPEDLPPGWHHDLVAVEDAVEMFELWLTPGYVARSHHAVNDHGARGHVWVTAKGGPAAEVPWDELPLAAPPPPPHGVLSDPMAAVGGEPGSWSYLCASILARELAELGNTGAFARWEKLRICAEPLGRIGDDPGFWREEPPLDLRPVVIEDNNGVTVRCYCFRHDPLHVVRLDDWYREGDLEAIRREILVALQARPTD